MKSEPSVTSIDGCRAVVCLFSLHSLSLFSCWHNVTPFTLHAVLVHSQMNYELLLYFKLTRVDAGNVSKKGKNMKGIIS